MKIAIFNPQSDFTSEQQKKLSLLGEVVYVKDHKELPVEELIEMAKGAEIIGVDPDPLGGFEKAKATLTKIIESLPQLKGISLSTTSYGWVDLEYCRKRNIPVSNIPGYSRESVAEHTLALMLCLAKKIIVTDRKTQKGKYELQMGFELKGKTLGIIGLGSIGSRVAELGNAIGMKVIAYNRSPKKQPGVKMKSLTEIYKEADVISLHLIDSEQTKGIINKEALDQMKQGVIIVSTADHRLVDENAMAVAIKSGKVAGYAYEDEDLENTPLAHLENVVGLQGFGWYTKEALQNLFEIWVNNIVTLSSGKPQNIV